MHIVSREEMYAVDQYTIEKIGISGNMLMENAGNAIFHHLTNHLKKSDRIGVMIGKGNNGGDGFVISRYLYQSGYDIDVWLVPNKEDITGDAKNHLDIFMNSGGQLQSYQDGFFEKCSGYTVIIDALLGIGVKGSLRHPYGEIIHVMNQSKAKIISVDIPSGVPADGGAFVHEVVKADQTLTLHRPKLGQFTFPAANFFGETKVLDIGIPHRVDEDLEINRELWTKRAVVESLPQREINAHKGSHGKALLVAGSQSMPGAASLSALSALQSGIGLLTLATKKSIQPIIASRVPEVMFYLMDDHNDKINAVNNYDAIALGPGLGRNTYSKGLLEQLLSINLPLIIDADGLYYLNDFLPLLRNRKHPTILTPHPGEMAHLSRCSISDVENQRFKVSFDFATANHVYLVLKGPYTIVTTPDGKQYVNTTGNPSLAKGGSGDVLTGMILAFLLQHQTAQEAISNAVFVHGKVADDLIKANHSMLDIRASDIIDGISMVMHSLYQSYDG